jgi:glycerol-3-phosphate dehydrogenase
VFRKLGKRPPTCLTTRTPVHGAHFSRFRDLEREAGARLGRHLSPNVLRHLLYGHGSEYDAVARLVDAEESLAGTLGSSSTIRAEIVHAARAEMTVKLADVVLRRTDLGTGGYPGDETLRTCAVLMAREKGWDEAAVRQQIDEVTAIYPPWVRAGGAGVPR